MRRLLILLLLAAPLALRAQRVYWDLGGATLQYNQAAQLSLVFEGCTPTRDVKLPAIDHLTVGTPWTSTSINSVNGAVTTRYSLTYPVQPDTRGTIRIPAFDVATDKGLQQVPAADFAIGAPAVAGAPLDSIASARLAPARATWWAGQVFPLTYTLDVATRYLPSLGSDISWDPAPLVIENWSAPEQIQRRVDGEARLGIEQKTRGEIHTPGVYTLPAAQQAVNLNTGTNSDPFNLFAFPTATRKTVVSNRPEFTIRALPAPAPADFSGAVGRFTLDSKVVPASASVGSPITWTLTLAGEGNWPDITALPPREASRDFQAVPSQPKRATKPGKLFDGSLSQDVVLIPTQPGAYTLGPVRCAYFDPEAGVYKTLTTEPVTILITPAAGAPPAPGETASAAAVAPPPPGPIPRDPLPGAANGRAPFSPGALLLLCLLPPLLIVLLGWLALACLHARRADPWRARRAAHAALARLLAELRARPAAPGAALEAPRDWLRAWQSRAAALLELAGAAPTAALPTLADSPWPALWSEADRALYSETPALPADWPARAEAALRAQVIPAWSLASVFTRRHLLPFLAVLLVLFAAPRLPAQSADVAGTPAAPVSPAVARADYEHGDFAAAAKIWRADAAHAPTDWIARHNLALALAQQDRWPEAAAQLSSAFLLNPHNASVRWHLALAFARAGFAPEPLAAFTRSDPQHDFAALASPAGWQRVLIACALLAALAALLGLLRLYGARVPAFRPLAWTALALIILGVAAAWIGLRAYGPAADARAALVWRDTTLRSIPTTAGASQQTSPLAAGTLAVVDKTFLGWDRLAFPDGQTGWVRRDDVVPLYR